MKYFLQNEFAPVTFDLGFVDIPFDRAASFFASWIEFVHHLHGLEYSLAHLDGKLPELLEQLFPVVTPPDREMLVSTRGGWTAYFDNSLGGNAATRVGYMCNELSCRGVAVSCAPHVQSSGDRGVYGAVTFDMFAPHATEFLNRLRSIRVVNNDGWEFFAIGPEQPFEEKEKYSSRRTVDRFTPEMLERYCLALGIDVFNADFYGPTALMATTRSPLPHTSLPLSRTEARAKLGLA